MPTIKLSKNQWEFIGEKAGWIKKAQSVAIQKKECHKCHGTGAFDGMPCSMCNGKGHITKEDSDSYYHSMGVSPCPHKKAQIIPDDGYADGGEPYTEEEMDLMEKENGVTIFKLIEDWKDQGYGIALISPDDKIVEPYIDPSDYPDMMLDKSGNGARVVGGKHKGCLIMFHSGQFEGNEGKYFFEAKSKA